MTRRHLIAGNWKMNTTRTEAVALGTTVAARPVEDIDVAVFPPFPWLISVREAIDGSHVALGAQDCWTEPSGAFTGAVSASMLAEICSMVIAGHSERRKLFGESDRLPQRHFGAGFRRLPAQGAEGPRLKLA